MLTLQVIEKTSGEETQGKQSNPKKPKNHVKKGAKKEQLTPS